MSTTGHEKEAVNVEGLKAALKSGGNKAIFNEAICSTASATAAKVTNTTPPSFSLVSGAKIIVKFTYGISVANATLQVGNTAAKPIHFRGEPLGANIVKSATHLLLSYDGTAYNIIGGLGDGSGSCYVPTLETVPTSSTTTYVKDGKTYTFEIGQFARVYNGYTYDFYQLNDLRNNNTEAVWVAVQTIATPIYSAPTVKILTYNTQPQELLNAGFTEDGTIQYSSNGTDWSTDIPTATNAGDYIVYWRLIGDALHSNIPKTAISVTISKANPSYTAPTAKSGLKYNNTEQDLLNAGSTSDGTIKYSTDNENWSTNVPTGKNLGDYNCYWKLEGDINHINIDSTLIVVTINKGDGVVTTAPVGGNKEYTGSAMNLVTAGSGTGTMMYRLGSSGSWSSSIPTASTAGSYTIYYKAAENVNYTESPIGSTVTAIEYKHNGYEYVDLGLPSGTKWAKCNIGANAEEGDGNYYRMGYKNTYAKSQTPYSGAESPISLNVDTARQIMGGNWHIPSKTQIQELIDNTTLSSFTIGSRVCAKLTAPNGKYLVFPLCGYYVDSIDGVQNANGNTYFQGSTYINTISGNVYRDCILFTNASVVNEYVYNYTSAMGIPVRGVIG